jgi:hypothetical protein
VQILSGVIQTSGIIAGPRALIKRPMWVCLPSAIQTECSFVDFSNSFVELETTPRLLLIQCAMEGKP